ncbi:MAG: helix-turn-helix domain-containing protein [Coriobacteriia bacterium]|nr:helix-turn-helix domain-containing protein [Coriobacteriia bacterium]
MEQIDIKTPAELGQLMKRRRKELGLTQKSVVDVAPFGPTFYSDLENGKTTAQLGKTLEAIRMLGLRVAITLPDTTPPANSKDQS